MLANYVLPIFSIMLIMFSFLPCDIQKCARRRWRAAGKFEISSYLLWWWITPPHLHGLTSTATPRRRSPPSFSHREMKHCFFLFFFCICFQRNIKYCFCFCFSKDYDIFLLSYLKGLWHCFLVLFFQRILKLFSFFLFFQRIMILFSCFVFSKDYEIVFLYCFFKGLWNCFLFCFFKGLWNCFLLLFCCLQAQIKTVFLLVFVKRYEILFWFLKIVFFFVFVKICKLLFCVLKTVFLLFCPFLFFQGKKKEKEKKTFCCSVFSKR